MSVHRISSVGVFVLLAAACGQPFTAAPAGSGGRDTAGAQASSGGEAGARGAQAGTGGTESSGAGGDGGRGGGALASASLVPREGLELWLDAQVGVTEVSGGVVTWEDRSPHRRDALQTASNYRPKLSKSGPGDQAAIQFDGENDYLKVPTLPGDFSRGLTLFLVNRQRSLPEVCDAFFEASRGREMQDVHFGTWEGALLYEVIEEWIHPTEQSLLVDSPQLLAVVHDTSGLAHLRRNSASVTEQMLPLPETIERDNVFIGRSLYGECQYFHGDVSELLLYNRRVSDLELIQIETYLQSKWGCCSE